MGSLDYESTLATVAGLALPELGSWSILDLIESGSIRRVAIVHPDPEMQILARKLQRQWPPETEDPLGAPVVVRTAAPQVVSRVTDKLLMEVARDEENLAILRKLGIESFLVVPLISSNGILGAITFISGPTGRRHTKRDLAKAQGLAAVSALAIEHARMHRESQDARNQAAERAEVAERQQRDLERLMEIQARLVRGFSHDVKNPLGAALGYASMLEEGLMATPRKRSESIHRMSASIRSALTLIDDLVEYAKSRMGKVEIRPGPTNVNELVEEIAEEYRAQIEAAGLTLKVEEAELPIIESDRIRIREILGNLLSNAVKYSVKGTISLRTEMGAPDIAAPSSEWIAVHVADEGIGISEENQRLIFQEFARLDPSATQGSGLGLTISQWIAQALGGDISVESRLGQGSTFTLWVPVTNASSPATRSRMPAKRLEKKRTRSLP